MPCRTKEAQAKSARKHYLNNKDKLKARARAWTNESNRRLRELINSWKSVGCQAQGCNEKEICCLVAHHIDPSTKSFNIGNAASHSIGIKRVTAELAKCACLCANCHTKLHAGLPVIFSHGAVLVSTGP